MTDYKNKKTDNRMPRKSAIEMKELMHQYIKVMGLSSYINRQCIFAAWDKVSGASQFTLNQFVKDGILYCNISSSMVRNQLYFQRDSLVRKINEELEKDEMFIREDKFVSFVKSIILR